MHRIAIYNQDHTISAEILPDYGGMVASLRVCGRDVLFLDESRLADSPISAGGIPVLFPFAGRTKNDRYEINGTGYYMPMHGLVKNRSFTVKEQSEHMVTVWVKHDEAMLKRNYPFPHSLELAYHLIDDTLVITAHIENHSDTPMPHALGWHPYFKASDRALLEFSHDMTIHYDYTHQRDSKVPNTIKLDLEWDDVFCQPIAGGYTLTNAPDGYQVCCVTDNAFQSIVVYTGKPGSVCIEPWCGIPDSINNKRMLQWITPGGSSDYRVSYQLKALVKGNEDDQEV